MADIERAADEYRMHWDDELQPCPTCNGVGVDAFGRCGDCGGSGDRRDCRYLGDDYDWR